MIITTIAQFAFPYSFWFSFSEEEDSLLAKVGAKGILDEDISAI